MLPIQMVQTPREQSLAERIALAAWMAPILTIGLNLLTGGAMDNRAVALSVGALMAILILIGLSVSVWIVISGIATGPRTLLIHGGIGLVLNGLLVFLIVGSIVALREIAAQQNAEQGNNAADRSPDAPIPQGPGWYVNRERTFAIRIPDNWQVREVGKDDVVIVALSPPESATDTFRENIVVGVSRIPKSCDTTSYADAGLRDIRASRDGPTLDATGRFRLDGLNCVWASFHDRDGDLATAGKTHFIAHHGRGYMITCTGTPDGLDRFREQFDSSVKTFRVLPDRE